MWAGVSALQGGARGGGGSADVSTPGKPAFAEHIKLLRMRKDTSYLESSMHDVREDSQAHIPLLVKAALPVMRLSAMVRFESCWKPEVLPHAAGNVPVKLRPCRYSVDSIGKDSSVAHDAGNVPVAGQSMY